MAGVYKLEITETEADLKQRLRSQKTASDKERIQLLYLLKTKQATTIQSAATLLGRHRVTVQEWLRLYRNGGLEAMLAHKPRTGRRQSIPQWAQVALNKQLHQSEGFRRPDVLVSDIGMADMDGYRLIEQIRSRPPTQGGLVPAIPLTAYAAELDQKKALQAGFQQHLTKPLEPERLVSTIVNLLKSN
jgi:CheY-like chemotaxis protein